MPSMSWLHGWLGSYRDIVGVEAVREGFLCGLGIGLVITLGVVLVILLCSARRRHCRMIVIPGDGGDLIVSAQAVREFLQRIVAEFRDLELLGVQLYRRRQATDITVRLDAVPGANVRELRDALKDTIRAETAAKLGFGDVLGSIHIEVLRYSANERRIARKAGKALGTAAAAPSVPVPYPSYAGAEETGEEPRAEAPGA